MLSLTLRKLGGELQPQISDLAACKRWLAALPLSNVQAAHGEIGGQLELLNCFPVAPLERLRIMEHLRETVDFVQAEVAKKYLNKPVPFDKAEQAAWNNVLALWQSMAEAYQRGLQACIDGDMEVAEYVALITQRCLRYCAMQMLEQYRAFRELDGESWRQLHALHAFAEKKGFAARPVKDSLNHQVEATTCGAAYVQALLTFLANPYQLSSRQLAQLQRWLEKWAVRVPVLPRQPQNAGLSPLAVDLNGAMPPAVASADSPLAEPRYLDSESLASTIRKRIKFLRKGGAPAEVGLGEDCVAPACEVFLTALYQHWCEIPVPRACARHAGSATAEIAFDVPSMHFFISGEKPFNETGKARALRQEELRDLQMFGHVRTPAEKPSAAQAGFTSETWEIQDESALGFRLARKGASGSRVGNNQLLAVRPSDGAGFVLGVVRWLMLTAQGELHVGVHALPGAPTAIAARRVALNTADKHRFAQAFRLPEVAALQAPESLVLPAGWFHPGGTMDIAEGDEVRGVRMLALIEKGADYERVSFLNPAARNEPPRDFIYPQDPKILI
jgi:hypothetical protein